MAKGQKTGGRAKGTPNKVTAAREAEIAATGLTPLEFMLALLRDEEAEYDARFEAAKAAAPYVHPRLANVNARVDGELTLESLITVSLEGKP